MDDVARETPRVRGFPAPWIVIEQADGFRIEDANGLAIAWTAFSVDDSVEREAASLTRAEAHRIAKAIAMVPEMRTIIRSLQEGLAASDADMSED